MNAAVESSPAPPTTRPRAKSSFSLRSDKSGESKSLAETTDKFRRDSFLRGESKANPNAAVNELQPGAANVLEKSTLETLRDTQYKDAHGNLITEPDLCNPTRPRWERPLDTIRSFEKAIDGGYGRKSSSRSMSRNDMNESNNNYTSQRGSYYGAHDAGRYDSAPSPTRYSQAGPPGAPGHYGNRRQENYFDQYGQPMAAPASRNRYGLGPRVNSESRIGQSGGYPQHNGYRQSHDTMDTGMTNGSDSTGPWNNSTNPSSENSSLDKIHGTGRQSHTPEPYGARISEEYGAEDGAYARPGASNGGYSGYPNGRQMAPQPQAAPAARQPIKLGGGDEFSSFAKPGGALPSTARPVAEEKKGWFKRKPSEPKEKKVKEPKAPKEKKEKKGKKEDKE